MNILKIILDVIRFILNVAWFSFVLCFLLYGGKWQVGNFMSITMPGLFRNSKKTFKEKGLNK